MSTLTDVLDDPAIDPDSLVRDLAHAAAESVASLVSITLTVFVEDYPFSITVSTTDGTAAVALSSAWIPLPTAKESVIPSGILLFADVVGAFVDLAADCAYTLSLDPQVIELDAHLQVSATAVLDVMDGLDERTTIDQALGVLIERGHKLDHAHIELRSLAKRHECTLARAARGVLDGAITTGDDSAN